VDLPLNYFVLVQITGDVRNIKIALISEKQPDLAINEERPSTDDFDEMSDHEETPLFSELQLGVKVLDQASNLNPPVGARSLHGSSGWNLDRLECEWTNLSLVRGFRRPTGPAML